MVEHYRQDLTKATATLFNIKGENVSNEILNEIVPTIEVMPSSEILATGTLTVTRKIRVYGGIVRCRLVAEDTCTDYGFRITRNGANLDVFGRIYVVPAVAQSYNEVIHFPRPIDLEVGDSISNVATGTYTVGNWLLFYNFLD